MGSSSVGMVDYLGMHMHSLLVYLQLPRQLPSQVELVDAQPFQCELAWMPAHHYQPSLHAIDMQLRRRKVADKFKNPT